MSSEKRNLYIKAIPMKLYKKIERIWKRNKTVNDYVKLLDILILSKHRKYFKLFKTMKLQG